MQAYLVASSPLYVTSRSGDAARVVPGMQSRRAINASSTI
jgi:hypothetical protein